MLAFINPILISSCAMIRGLMITYYSMKWPTFLSNLPVVGRTDLQFPARTKFSIWTRRLWNSSCTLCRQVMKMIWKKYVIFIVSGGTPIQLITKWFYWCLWMTTIAKDLKAIATAHWETIGVSYMLLLEEIASVLFILILLRDIISIRLNLFLKECEILSKLVAG